MQCHRRNVLFVSFLLQIGILILYTFFQISNNSSFLVKIYDNPANDSYRGEIKRTVSSEFVSTNTNLARKIQVNSSKNNKSAADISSPGQRLTMMNISHFGKGKVFVTSEMTKNDTELLDGKKTTDDERLKPRYLVCPDPLGRLGNMMFEFAASVGIANTLGYQNIIKPSHTLVKYFEIKQVLNIKLENLLTVNEGQWRNKKWREDKKYLTHNLTLSGYFQSFKYFHNVFSELRKMFAVKGEYLNQAIKFLKENTPDVRTLIGLHVRRGDFLTKTSQKEGRVVADRNYTRKSINFFRGNYKDAFFVVLSDDQKWCKDNINGSDVIFSPFKEPIVDMAILSLCNHTIITSGSYGWWGAWLANGTVVYLKDFPKPGSSLDKSGLIRDEYYFPHWIGMNNKG